MALSTARTGSGEGLPGSAAAGGQGDGHDAKAGKRRYPTAGAGSRPSKRFRPLVTPAGRRAARPAREGGGRRGPAAGTRPPEPFARTGAAGGKARTTKTGAGEIECSKQGHRRNAGTGATDPGRLPGRPQTSRDRAGIAGLAVDRATCYHRHQTRAPQDGAIDGPSLGAGIHAVEFESARFRCDEGSGYPQGWWSAEIEAVPRVWAAMGTSMPPVWRNKQKRDLRMGNGKSCTVSWLAARRIPGSR